MPQFIVTITAPNGEPFTREEMEEVVHEGLTEVHGWRAFNRGFGYEVVEVTA